MKAPLRTKSIGTKVSEEEFAALDATARAADMTLSEWVRAVLLAAPGVELPGNESAGEAALAGRVAQVPGKEIEFSHKRWVPQVPRLWAPGRPQTSAGRSYTFSTSVVIRCTLLIDAVRTHP